MGIRCRRETGSGGHQPGAHLQIYHHVAQYVSSQWVPTVGTEIAILEDQLAAFLRVLGMWMNLRQHIDRLQEAGFFLHVQWAPYPRRPCTSCKACVVTALRRPATPCDHATSRSLFPRRSLSAVSEERGAQHDTCREALQRLPISVAARYTAIEC